jgi:hypothetical protein
VTLWFRNFRISILNWLAAGRITIQKNKKPQEYNMSQSTYTLGGTSPGTININPTGYGITQGPQNSQTMTIKITPANGGTIVQMSANDYTNGELYIIADGEDFDRELGKIITMSKLKA